jgi:type IX secretion system PorP/SprF family membrane protein
MKFFLAIFIISLSFSLKAQQAEQYSQYAFNNFGYNPAFLGTIKCVDLKLGNRMQWVGFDGAPASTFASFQVPLKRKRFKNRGRHALGFYVNQDKVHLTARSTVKLAYAYTTKLSLKYTLSAGVFAGIQQYNTTLVGRENNADPVLASAGGVVIRYPDIMPGVLLYNKSVYWSFSINQLFFRDIKLGQDQKQVLQYQFGGGQKTIYGDWTVFKTFLLRWNILAPPSIDLNVAWLYKQTVSFGVGYRVGESAIANVKFNLDGVKVGYAFDYPLNQLRGHYGHEIMIGFSRCKLGGSPTGGDDIPYVCPSY